MTTVEKNELIVMDVNGDTRTTWDSSRPEEVDVARETFEKLKVKRYLAYRVRSDGGKGELITEFDPKAGKLIMSPPMAGG